jgi:hypothetical protein
VVKAEFRDGKTEQSDNLRKVLFREARDSFAQIVVKLENEREFRNDKDVLDVFLQTDKHNPSTALGIIGMRPSEHAKS